MEQPLEITQTGQDALRQRAVSGRERQIMLLASGGQSSRQILQAMGDEAQVLLRRLMQQGLLQKRGEGQSAAAIFAQSIQAMSPEAQAASPAPHMSGNGPDAPPATPTASASTSAPSAEAAPQPQREPGWPRSLHDSIVYITGLLVMMDTAQSRRMAQLLQQPSSQDEQALLLDSIEYLRFAARPELAQRILHQLHAMLPVALLPALEQIATATAPSRGMG